MGKFYVGQKVYWRDPANETSGVYEVYEKRGEIILIGNGFSEAEVYESELVPLSQKVMFRKWVIQGTVMALFPEQELDENPLTVASYDSEAQTPFIWQVRDTGTWLYFFDEADWKKRLSDRIEFYKSASHDNVYYYFDGEEFYPVFEQTVLKMINE